MKSNIDGDARFWGRIAQKYSAGKIKDLPGYERTLDCTRSFLRASDTVLELGCGTGTTALALAPYVSRIAATDVSNEMIAIAREKAAAHHCSNADFKIATLDSVSWPDGSFDAVLAFNLLHLLTTRAVRFTQVSRLLKPGGFFITKTPCLAEMNALIRLAVPLMQMVGKAPYVEFFSAGDLVREIEASGFTIIERARHGSGRKDPRIFVVARTAGPEHT